jgi:hypothetical protein
MRFVLGFVMKAQYVFGEVGTEFYTLCHFIWFWKYWSRLINTTRLVSVYSENRIIVNINLEIRVI